MRFLKSLTLYAGLSLGAISVQAAQADTGSNTGALIALAQGDLARIQFDPDPAPVADASFTDANGKTVMMAQYQGKYVLLNFWALWCPPCIAEMPDLNALAKAEIHPDFEVVTIATGRNARMAVDKFFIEKELDALPKLFDPRMKMARAFGALGLPVTVLIDPAGNEVARAIGELKWDSPEAHELFRAWTHGS